jgi:ABC-2 type transport system permease protein
MLPTWILVLVLMVGFIVIPAQVAEEKERKLLLGLLQTPIREVEWLLAKVCFGTIAILIAALLLHLLTKFDFDLGAGLGYLLFLLAGGFCFSAFGIYAERKRLREPWACYSISRTCCRRRWPSFPGP